MMILPFCKVRVIGAPDGPGTSKRKAIVLDDDEDDKEKVRKTIESPGKKKAVAHKVPSERARRLEELRVSIVTLNVEDQETLG